MVNNIKKIGIVLIVFFFCSCKKEKNQEHKKESPQTLQQELYNKIDSFIDSSNCGEKEVVSIRYQMYLKKEFVQISAQSVFITDSLFILKEHKSHIIAFYNRAFFEKILEYNNNENTRTIKKNAKWDLYKSNYTGTGIPCFDMYELIDRKLVPVPKNSFYYNNLFANPPMLEPAPPPVK